MLPLSRPFLAVCLQAVLAVANTEKAIFLGPASIAVPLEHPTLDDLGLDVLSPAAASSPSIRTRLEAQFPTASYPHGAATWLLLDGLEEGRRYEVRVCWAATQPTAFRVITHEVEDVWATPELITSLWEYSTSRLQAQAASDDDGKTNRHNTPPPSPIIAPRSPSDGQPQAQKQREASVLLLQILAAADYVSANATVMRDVARVDADVILDPFVLLNAVPRSLLPTAAYIVVVAAAAFYVARYVVVARLRAFVAAAAAAAADDKQGDRKRPNKKTR
ncbi:hypothetical protein B0T26DRAFT_743740 [Lasiosphaeria miniovina]|uniref:Uncharacterized protein n=1 Tax=Lasiosphaeria miniovina TaxID=1954250 RepID=A0AA39ZZG4_9PEZI|nr:uncharacterized protein B0T26DRAFT_743740 [Lasiosphaeria miniovina]KAK0706501.1 hypothetical protein B0T26DRAFT_743740 [Lasiosphaeria miniovina]